MAIANAPNPAALIVRFENALTGRPQLKWGPGYLGNVFSVV